MIGDKIVVRTRRSIIWDNGTVFEGFVDASTGKPDGEGTVTWGANAGRSKRKYYSGLFTAGFTAERVSFDWHEQRPGQPHKGHHAYRGTVEVCHPYCHFAPCHAIFRFRAVRGQEKLSSRTTSMR